LTLIRNASIAREQELQSKLKNMQQSLSAKEDMSSQLFRSNLVLSTHVDQQEEWIRDLSKRLQDCERQLAKTGAGDSGACCPENSSCSLM
jgi:hypothetical protein